MLPQTSEIEAFGLDSVKRQIIVNCGLIAISGFVIFFSESFVNEEFVSLDACLGADFAFTMISALLGSFGWRFAEKISASIWDVVCVIFAMALVIVYGAAIAMEGNLFVVSMIRYSFWAFLIFYIIDIIIILQHFKHKQEVANRKKQRQRNSDYIGYIRSNINGGSE